MTPSPAIPESRNNCSAAGTRASAKANRSRTVTGEEWWLMPITSIGMLKKRGPRISQPQSSGHSWVVNWRQQIASPKCQQHKDKAANCAQGKPPATLREFPTHDDQTQVKQPDHHRPYDFS